MELHFGQCARASKDSGGEEPFRRKLAGLGVGAGQLL